MATFTAKDVQALREATGAGMMDCKKALTECAGDFDKAVTWLREKGMASAAKRSGRTAAEGAVASYIHLGGKIGVLVEVNCETDFVARTDDFQAFCRDICLQIASAAPRYVQREDVPQEVVEAERKIALVQAQENAKGKPEHVLQKIADGRLNKWYQEVCLLEQPFVKEPDKTVEQLTKELSGKVGEKIAVRRFTRYQLGEGIERRQTDLAAEVAAATGQVSGQ
jgi:elongation factor Ts